MNRENKFVDDMRLKKGNETSPKKGFGAKYDKL